MDPVADAQHQGRIDREPGVAQGLPVAFGLLQGAVGAGIGHEQDAAPPPLQEPGGHIVHGAEIITDTRENIPPLHVPVDEEDRHLLRRAADVLRLLRVEAGAGVGRADEDQGVHFFREEHLDVALLALTVETAGGEEGAVAVLLQGLLEEGDAVGHEQVGDVRHQDADSVDRADTQPLGEDIRRIPAALDDLQHFGARAGGDFLRTVEDTGDGGDGNAGLLCDIVNVHVCLPAADR